MEYTEAKVKDIFVDFLKGYKDEKNELKYRIQVSQLPGTTSRSLIVDYSDLEGYSTDLATSLVNEPDLFLSSFDDAAVETLDIENPVYADKIRKELRVRLRDLSDRVSLRGVTKNELNKLILVAGMVTRTSELRPLAVNAAFRCFNGHITFIEQTGSGTTLKRPIKCETEGCGETKNFELDDLKTEFIDFQVIKVQEMPEELPPGQLPQSFDVNLTGDIVNSARPGDRVFLTGIVKAESENIGGYSRKLFNSRIEANYVEQISKRSEEQQVSREEEDAIKTLAALPGAYDRLVASIAPAIFGHELHKEAALLLMVGSPQKTLPDGSTLRGDVNILLVGDPGCLVFDERIVLGNGSIAKIGQMGSHHLQELSTQVLTGEGMGKRATATIFHIYRNQPVMEIITESGKSLKGTPNHPVLARVRVLGSLDNEWRRLDEFKIGDRVIVSSGFPSTLTALAKTGFRPMVRKNNLGPVFKGKLPELMNEDLACLLGYMLGDGWVRESGTQSGFVVADTDNDILPTLLKLTKNLFGIEGKVLSKKAPGRTVVLHYVTIHSIDVAANLCFLRTKRVPDLIFASPNKVIASFLSWLYEADGTVFPQKRGVGSVGLKSVQVELLRDVQLLLLRFGIHSRIIGNALVIRRGRDILRFAEKVGFGCLRKKARLADLVEVAKKKKRFHGQRIERVVKIIQHAPQDVYDIEVPEGHRFIANGIISHNTAKSELLKYVARVAPRGLFTSGRGSTAAGLTAAVVKEKNGMMMLEAGATVLADLGVACIDEFDKMRDEDRSALHEVMEQQTVSVAKGGIIATLNARTSILAAANPVDGKYDPYKNILENVALPVPLLTRFDLIFIIRDEADQAMDESVARHILDMRAKSSFPTAPPIEFELLKKYIIYVKRLDPELTEEARNRLSTYYIKLRREASPEQISVTPRWLEGMIRLSIARARILLHPRVTEDDALHAVNLIDRMLRTVAVDQSTKKVDVGVLYNKPISEKGLREAALDVFKALTGESKQPVEDKAFYEEIAKTGKFTREQAEKVFQDMWKSGVIYEVRAHFFKKT